MLEVWHGPTVGARLRATLHVLAFRPQAGSYMLAVIPAQALNFLL
jgi:hypothetical protein